MQHPANIGKYEVLEFLGGGMSHVYKARDSAIDRLVAVKVLTDEGCQDPDAKARFLQEARMAGNIEHENIIRIHDYGEAEGRPFIVMEFLVGEDLRQAIRGGHTGDLDNKLRIALDIARALEYVHSRKIIHRDIKPENVHIDRSGRVKLMDFGIAKAEGLSLTRTGFSVGTPYYMAPEQVRGEPATEQSDVYAFGILLYELLTGSKPFQGESIETLFFAILNQPLSPEPMTQAGASKQVADLVSRCTAKTAPERPGNFRQVVAEIEKLRQKPVIVNPPQPPARPRPVALIGVVAAVAIFAVAGAIYFLRSSGEAKPQVAAKKELAQTLADASGDMVLVPAGAFLSGPDKQSVTLQAFYIDRTEVSCSAFERFCKAKGRPLPAGCTPDRTAYPVVNITIADARDFAAWAGKRLPSALEWEKAARGSDGRIYPWGDEADTARANVAGSATSPVSAFESFAGPFKAVNMTGNVWEFVDDRRTPSDRAVRSFAKLLNPPPTADEPWCTIRGGSFETPLAAGVLHEWTSAPERFAARDIGFRCAKTP